MAQPKRRFSQFFLGMEPASAPGMSLRHLLLVFPFVGFACANSHGAVDAGSTVDAGAMCVAPAPECNVECGSSDGLIPATCTDTGWECPAGSIDQSTCCPGDPRPGCVCAGTGWICDSGCPSGIDPWNPDAPGSACSTEGATCSEGTQCGSAMFCTCESGSWNCAVAEPDPVCTCGREPSVGDPCVVEGIETECGQCCPTAAGPNWPAMTCVDGAWQPAACPEIACPEALLECPVDVEAELGRTCAHEDQSCGNPCCGSIQCMGGIWQRGPEVACACAAPVPCGVGSCTGQQSCNLRCGPDDGPDYRCVTLPSGCSDCGCLPLLAGQSCEMVEGQPHVLEEEFCG